jgi:8-oxo-dGTP pyrophosphatase MutT (NUDIX family)
MDRPDAFRDRLAGVLGPPSTPVGMEDVPEGTALAAVLVPVLTASLEPRVVFTRRTDTLSRHAGEISFPGGLAEADEDLPGTALREAEEELGLLPADVELVGALPPIHTRVTGILIAPFVGVLHTDPRFTPNAAEIADVLEFPLESLVAAGTERELEHDGRRFHTFVYDMDGQVIWGATARILHSLLELIGSPSGDGSSRLDG